MSARLNLHIPDPTTAEIIADAFEAVATELRAENARLRSALRALLTANTEHDTDEPDWHAAVAGARAALTEGGV